MLAFPDHIESMGEINQIEIGGLQNRFRWYRTLRRLTVLMNNLVGGRGQFFPDFQYRWTSFREFGCEQSDLADAAKADIGRTSTALKTESRENGPDFASRLICAG